jgi:hypothetical protein
MKFYFLSKVSHAQKTIKIRIKPMMQQGNKSQEMQA